MIRVSANNVDRNLLEDRLLEMSNDRSFFSLFTSAGTADGQGAFELVFGWGAKEFFDVGDLKANRFGGKWVFASLSYELRHHFEKLDRGNLSILDWPDLVLYCPEIVGTLKRNGTLEIYSEDQFTAEQILSELLQEFEPRPHGNVELAFTPLETEKEYLQAVRALQNHIQLGDIYEVNYCTAYAASYDELDEPRLFKNMVQSTEAPFSAYMSLGEHALLCTSPERYIKRRGKHLISQPIKGTNAVTTNNSEQRAELLASEKERAENVMIVDLVRNDLSRIAERGSVKVSELFGVYTFKNVNQLISTIEAEVKAEVSLWDILAATFPMGSMTGAPKVSAMQLSERYISP
jgi:para-aminobenzoate synthetase component 1